MKKVVDFYIDNNIDSFIQRKEEEARLENSFKKVVENYTIYKVEN